MYLAPITSSSICNHGILRCRTAEEVERHDDGGNNHNIHSESSILIDNVSQHWMHDASGDVVAFPEGSNKR